MMDLEDEVALSASDAWGLFRDRLESASQRYNPEAILAGRLYQTAEGVWTGRWLFIFNNQTYSLNSNALDMEQFPVAAIDAVTEYLARHYAVDTSVEERAIIKVWVSGVESLKDFGAVTEYLNKFALITQVMVSRVVKDSLLLNLTTNGDAQKLVEAIALDNKLLPATVSDVQPIEQTGASELVFHWQP